MERGGCKWTPHPWIWQTDGVARGLSDLLYPGCIMIQAHEFYLQLSTWPCITAFLGLWGMWNAAVKAFSLVTRSAHACAVESMHTGDRSKTEAPTNKHLLTYNAWKHSLLAHLITTLDPPLLFGLRPRVQENISTAQTTDSLKTGFYAICLSGYHAWQ